MSWSHVSYAQYAMENLCDIFVPPPDSFELQGCWASSGYSVQGCAQLEEALRECMDAPVSGMLRIAPTMGRQRRRKTKLTLGIL